MIPQDDPTAQQQRLNQLRAELDTWVANTQAGMSPADRQVAIRGLDAFRWVEMLADLVHSSVTSGGVFVALKYHATLLELMPEAARAALAAIQASGLMGATQLAWPEDLRPDGAPVFSDEISTDREDEESSLQYSSDEDGGQLPPPN